MLCVLVMLWELDEIWDEDADLQGQSEQVQQPNILPTEAKMSVQMEALLCSWFHVCIKSYH